MKNKILTTLFIFGCLIIQKVYGQLGLSQDLKDRYYDNSIIVGAIDNSLYDSLKIANAEHPSRFFMMCGSFIQDSMMNEAAVAYFIGRNRYQIYNRTNPDYEDSGDGALAGSFAYAFAELLNDHLVRNIENYGKVMQITGVWYTKNKHYYFENATNDSLYEHQTNAIIEFADMLLNKPDAYIKKLEEEKKEMDEFLQKLKDSMEEIELDEDEDEDEDEDMEDEN